MAVNHYFWNYDAKNEQRLLEGIIQESIQIMGFPAYYIPNSNDAARDLLFGEDPLKKFTTSYKMEMYLQNASDYGGDREFFSKFGLEIRNTVSVALSKATFNKYLNGVMTRPREGDLVYIPFLNGTGELFEIKFVNQTSDFFNLGRQQPYVYQLELEKFKYSQEFIATGVDEIDIVSFDSAYQIDFNMNTGSGDYIYKEIVFTSPDNTYANASATGFMQSWDKVTKILTLSNMAGDFANGANVIGKTSGTHWTIQNYDPLNVQVHNENYDNKVINDQATQVIDNTENNPFGSI